MRVLIDTNIFIPMEDSNLNISNELATLHRLSQLNLELLIHPESKNDLLRDKSEKRKNAMLSRLAKYNTLDSPIYLDDSLEIELFGKPKKENDKVDNRILFALVKNCVHFLVTEDYGIHKKAKKLNLSERVLTIKELITTVNCLENREYIKHPSINDINCYELNLDDDLFSSLREGYQDFNQWFNNKCCKEGRKAWALFNQNKNLNALCIYNIETNPEVTSDNKFLSGNVLKLCTFKVKKTGIKLGELLLKHSFKFAIKNKLNYIYLLFRTPLSIFIFYTKPV